MTNNPILWVLLAVGAALLVGVFLWMNPGAPKATGPLPGQLLPEAIEGFILVNKESRIDPIFPGEDHSAHASYTPTPGGPWSGKVDHLGIAIFKFKEAAKISEARNLLITYEKTEQQTLEGVTLELASDEGEVGVFWQEGTLFVAILATAPAGESADLQTLRAAAQAAAKAVLALRPRSQPQRPR
ncbi:MAG: hypothetical protein NZ610_07740 [Candidatus Bipolaricaulota bacterium]|nr:hypothetical protein [Candidatus Bipolaricaulota bacterium]MCS7275271.1 hypothetical protein [Candidatus Bipolaricaulota bacterium]MDW8111549.1 hypothetical protein [Candidatus Bipolaricaulota bacterium]MDW8329437.1 hypothetical protein [Candidatus Bipolaricaulota bacterium]